jgi:hypothetical protein
MENQPIYCGSGKTKQGKYGEFFSISICLSDLPKEHITESKNGKKYINLNVNRKQQPDQYGKDLSVQVDTWKPDPAKATPPPAHTPKQEYSTPDSSDHLPF